MLTEYLETVKSFSNTNKFALIGLTSLASLIYLSKTFYFAGGHCKSKARLDGKTVIITGANTGIGKETALDLAKRGARVILACRDLNKAMQAANEIRKKSGNGNVFVELLDLNSLDSVKSFSDKINKQEERIDILINNAGIMMCPKWKTKDGFETQFGVNHLGHFLLTNLLLDKIKQSAPSRIINVSSLAYKSGRMNWDDLNWEKSYDPNKAYGQSKLSNVLFTRELAKRLEGTKVTVNTLHPGVVKTELARHLNETFGWKFYLAKIILMLFSFVFKNSYQGAQTTIHCAVDESLVNVTGIYFSDCAPQALAPHATNDEDAKRLWEISENFCKKKF